MSDFNTHRAVTVRKPKRCGWCGELITPGSDAERHAGVFDGDFYCVHMHRECHQAWESAPYEMLEDGWTLHSFARGSLDEAGSVVAP